MIEAKTFHDLHEVFRKSVQEGVPFNHIDIIFDRYYKVSIKSGTRTRCTKGTRPVRRVIVNGEVPLHSNYNNFLALQLKIELIWQDLFLKNSETKKIAVAEGFKEEEKVESTCAVTET